jgi:preprotein translocase subunit YajC
LDIATSRAVRGESPSEGTIVFYAATSSGGSSFTPFLLIVAFVVVIYFVLLRPNRRRQQNARQAHQDMLNNLGEGTKIVTIGGLHGTIVDSDADSVTLEISPGVHARYDRVAIAKVAPDDDDTMSPDPVSYEDDDDIVDGADLDSAHAEAEADDTDTPPASPNTAPTDGTEAPRSSADKND